MSRVAVFIDGDNVSAKHAPRIAELASGTGRVHVLRAYADATNGSGWNDVVGVQLIHAGCGKNAADILLSIDAIELAREGAFDTVLIVSSDSDFTHLAFRLRSRGIAVIGLGEGKAAENFRGACTRFEVLASVRHEAPHAGPRSMNKLDDAIRRLIQDYDPDGLKMHLSVLGKQLRNNSTLAAQHLPKGLKKHLLTRPDLYILDTPDHVRLKPTAQ